jgi:hypothetical protein
VEPDRHIEKVLRDYARERRAQAGGRLSLHPATRRLLQAEAARQHGRPAPPQRGFLDVFLLLGRHPGWSAMFTLLMLTIMGWWLLREPDLQLGREMAAQDAAPLSEMARAGRSTPFPSKQATPAAPAPSAVPAAPPQASLADARAERDFSRSQPPASESAGKKEAIVRDELAAARSPADESLAGRSAFGSASNAPLIAARRGPETARPLTTPPSPSLGITYERIQPESELSSNQSSGIAAATYDSPAVAAPGASRSLNSDQSYSVRQNFARTPAPIAKAKTATPTRQASHDILNNFELRQNGADIELVDADGSVYRGKLEEPAPSSTTARLSERPATALDDTASRALSLAPPRSQNQALSQQHPGIPFRVAGTNRTLRQAVVFNGELQNPMANQAANAPLSNQSNLVSNQANRPFQNTIQNSLSNAQISGRLRVGKEPETELLAVPKGGN